MAQPAVLAPPTMTMLFSPAFDGCVLQTNLECCCGFRKTVMAVGMNCTRRLQKYDGSSTGTLHGSQMTQVHTSRLQGRLQKLCVCVLADLNAPPKVDMQTPELNCFDDPVMPELTGSEALRTCPRKNVFVPSLPAAAAWLAPWVRKSAATESI